MQMKSIPLQSLSVNPANDRHGELADESTAIAWLLNRRPTHIRNLTRDIVKEQQVYEPPLVHEDNGVYTVYDGNRRVTCLKLMDDPLKSPSKEWQKFFELEASKWAGKFPTKIACQVESDRDRIDEILYRRHTGAQNGVGQSQWDAAAKSNFVGRTGKKARVNLAEEIESKLKENNYIDKNAKIPRSNLNRLLSAEAFRNRVGISVQRNHVEVTHDETKTMLALKRIVEDLIHKDITLDSIWSNKDKKSYLDSLERQNILPKAIDSLNKHRNLRSLKTVSSRPKTGIAAGQRPETRNTLIRSDINYGIIPQAHTQRLVDIWNELQHDLKFGQHDNAIAVLFRVLLEFSAENYIEQNNIASIYVNDKLSRKFDKVAEHMLANNSVTKKYRQNLKKFQRAEVLLSSTTLNAYVHHKNFFPSDIHLKSMWDSLADYIVICLNA